LCFVSTFQSTELSVFETNIRFVGGLLSAYALSGDKVRSVNHSIFSYNIHVDIIDGLK